MRSVFPAAIAVFLADQAAKYWVVHVLGLDRLGRMDVWSPYLNLRMGWNYGINFGLFAGDGTAARWGLIALALLISVGVIWWVRRTRGGVRQEIAAGLLIGGALGNVVDRVLYGAVADFLNMSCCGIDNPYAFNIADIAVFAGALGMIVFGAKEKAA